MEGGEGTQQVEKAANHGLAQGLRARQLHRAVQPQLLPGLLVGVTQVPAGHETQALIEAGLGALVGVAERQKEAPARVALLRLQDQAWRHDGPYEVHGGPGASGDLGGSGLALDAPEGLVSSKCYFGFFGVTNLITH